MSVREGSNITQISTKASLLLLFWEGCYCYFAKVYICTVHKGQQDETITACICIMKLLDLCLILNACYWPSYTLWYAKWRYNKNNKCTTATTQPAIKPWRRLNVRLINTVTCRIATVFFKLKQVYYSVQAHKQLISSARSMVNGDDDTHKQCKIG